MNKDRPDSELRRPDRRTLLKVLAAGGIGTAAFHRALAQEATRTELTVDSIRAAEWVAGIELSEEQRDELLGSIKRLQHQCRQLHSVSVDYDVLPALKFDPEMFDPESRLQALDRPEWLKTAIPSSTTVPTETKSWSFLTIRQLGHLLRERRVTAVQLAKHCLQRLSEVDPVLKCVVTLTEELAIRQAEQADEELAAGHDRGPLHGIPWGAKDLIAVTGYPTTWGAPQFRDQHPPETATVARKLEDAGAVLVAKLSLGALAMGDRWFGGQTRNPWNPKEGSSGSSAGSAAAVAAGTLPFTIGSETLGSIVSPSKRCGVTGLRPTFGRVSRKGCMSLSWSMDKLGPIARTVDDCGIVFDAVHGADNGDPTAVHRWFDWPVRLDLPAVRIGIVNDAPPSAADRVLINTLKKLGAALVPVSLPRQFPEWAISLMLDAEAATVFHKLTATNDTEGLNRWPATFRKLHFLSAIDYLHAARLRSQLMKAMASVFEKVDLYVGGSDLGLTNLTGHPTVVFPTTMSEGDSSQPQCSTLTGRLHDEATLLAVAKLVESELKINDQHPEISQLTEAK